MNTINIRTRKDSDLPKLAEILVKVHGVDGYPVEGVADPTAWLFSDNMIKTWVAELDGEVVGHVALSNPVEGDGAVELWLGENRNESDTVLVLGRLFVGPQGRGHALGKRLTSTATSYASSVGKSVVLDVMAKDSAAIHIYETLGWQKLGRIDHVFGANEVAPAFAYVWPRATNE